MQMLDYFNPLQAISIVGKSEIDFTPIANKFNPRAPDKINRFR